MAASERLFVFSLIGLASFTGSILLAMLVFGLH